jgi:hypothetical protein
MRTFRFIYTNGLDTVGLEEEMCFETEAEALQHACKQAAKLIAGSGKDPAEWQDWYVKIKDDVGNENTEPFVPVKPDISGKL